MQEVLDKIQFMFHKEVMEEKEWWERFKQKYLEKEKEQITKAYCDGFDELLPFHENDYYNQTYNSKKECQHIVTRVENNIQECLGCGKIN